MIFHDFALLSHGVARANSPRGSHVQREIMEGRLRRLTRPSCENHIVR